MPENVLMLTPEIKIIKFLAAPVVIRLKGDKGSGKVGKLIFHSDFYISPSPSFRTYQISENCNFLTNSSRKFLRKVELIQTGNNFTL